MINELIAWFIRLVKQKNQGFDVKKEQKQLKEDSLNGRVHYSDLGGQLNVKFGANSFPVINPSGEYGNFLPEDEHQKISGVETMACTVFATLKAIQIIIKLKYGINTNYSERFIAILAGISPTNGGSPHKVAEAIRKYGLIPQEMLPFNSGMSSREFYSKPDNWDELLEEGERWLKEYDFGHEWIFDFSHKNITEKSKTSPLPAGVYAWRSENGVYVKPDWARDNHWCLRFGQSESNYHKFRDSYQPWEKHIDWNYKFGFIKRYYVGKKNSNEVDAGKTLYDRFKSYDAIQVFPSGAVYTIGEFIKHELWYAKKGGFLQKMVDEALRANYKAGKIIPITQEQFDTMMKYAKLAGIKVEEYKGKDIEDWLANSTWLQDMFGMGLREAEKRGMFTGISEIDFENLMAYANLAGIKIEEDGLGKINKLKE